MTTKNLLLTLAGMALWCLLAALPAFAAPPASSGGPDSFGYEYTDSRNANGPEYNFVDIAATGRRMTTVGDDVFEGADIGFSFKFYDRDYTFCFITSNGFIQFGAGSTSFFPPSNFPSASDPNNIIAGFWSDMNNAQGGNIYYATLGAEPNRRFVVQYQDVINHNLSQRYSFQIHLLEGSNQIEAHYKRLDVTISPTNPPQRFAMGIESLTGNPGLGYMVREHTAANHTDLPDPPFAIRYTRPVVVTVESQYGTTKVTPAVGTYKREYQSLQRFEAPEFIYFDRIFNELATPGDVDAPEASRAYYRARNLGYAIDGEAVQGVERFFERTITRDMKVIWRWELEYAVYIESATGTAGAGDAGFGNPVPAIGRHWTKGNTEFTAAIDSAIESEAAGFRVSSTGYRVLNQFRTNTGLGKTIDPEGNRVAVDPLTVTQPYIIEWQWTGEWRYRFDANGGQPGESTTAFAGQAFVRFNNVTHFVGGGEKDVWVPAGTSVKVGAFYRTLDNCFTLADFGVSPGGNLGTLGSDVSALADEYVDGQTVNNRLARVRNVNATAPTEIRWLYEPTVFRATIPLGSSLGIVNPNALLVPDLCDNAVLSDSGPGPVLTPLDPTPTGDAIGPAVLWDRVGKKLYPTQPGNNQVQWPDANDPTRSYTIEIVSGYPSDVVDVPSEVEGSDGFRQTTATPNQLPVRNSNGALTGSYYQLEATLAGVDSTFPAAPTAHYHHLFDPVPDRRPPTKLDLDPADGWAFQERTYTDLGTDGDVDTSAPGKAFTTKAGGRSVLLYSYRTDPNKPADGNLDEEELRVRVVKSTAVNPLPPTDPKFVLGQRGLQLGGGDGPRGAYGMILRGGSQDSFILGPSFVVDYWLNAKGVQAGDEPVTILATGEDKLTVVLDHHLTRTAATLTSETQTIAVPFAFSSAADLEVRNTTTGAILEFPADFSVAPGQPTGSITLLNTASSSVGDALRIDRLAEGEAGSSLTVNYRGLKVSHPFTTAGPTWRHHVIHGFTDQFFGIQVTMLNYYLDGVRQEGGMVTSSLATTGVPYGTASAGITNQSLRVGAGAVPLRQLQIDNLRFFALATRSAPWLTPDELRDLRTETTALSEVPQVQFTFETAPTNGSFPNEGSYPTNAGLGPVPSDPEITAAGTWAHVALQEVATRLDSTLDNAGFGGSGYILNQISNYNANLYNRSAEVGAWGPIYPVNDSAKLYAADSRRLEVAYYENPYLIDPLEHPNVAWPYETAAFNQVVYPTFGPHRDKRIYIASRVGSEGVDVNGRPQQAFDLANYANLQIYNQSDNATVAGYNPNEEHALVAASNRAALKMKTLGEDLPNNPPLAAFALQEDLNAKSDPYTSDPWVLVQVDNVSTGEPEMAAYRVRKQRAGKVGFPRPSTEDLEQNPGLTYEDAPQPENRFLNIDPDQNYEFSYTFSYPVAAGDLLIPPYPLNLVIGNVTMLDSNGGNDAAQRVLWHDEYHHAWVISGGGKFFYKYFYPFRADFHLPGTAAGTPVPWVPDANTPFTGAPATMKPGEVVYHSFWRSDYPKLKRGETLTYQGGEYFNENPGTNGLPALVAMKAAEVVFDVATPGMILGDDNVMDYSARIIRPLDRREAAFTTAQMQAAGFTPASPKIFVVAERWYFEDLSGSLQRRFYFDSLAQKLVFRGYLNDKDGGDPDLTAGPDPINIVEPNVMTPDDLADILPLGDSPDWTKAVNAIHLRSQNPMLVRDETAPLTPPQQNQYLAGLKESPNVTTRIGVNLELVGAQADLAAEQARIAELQAELAKLERTYEIEQQNKYSLEGGQITVRQEDLDEVEAQLAGSQVNALTSKVSALGYDITLLPTQKESRFVQLDSLGVGSALVCNPKLLTAPTDGGSRYITIAENNRLELDGAPVSLHIIEIVPDRYRGAIKVIEGANAFSERVTLQHNADFGANSGDIYYEWWIRDAAPLDVVATEVLADGNLKEVDERGNSLWQQYIPAKRAVLTNEKAKHLGLHTIVFEGRPDVTLADKLVLMRYRHESETGWNLVPFEITNPGAEWKPQNPAPFQWAGAANSPQLQADGSKRYIPQLVMGWIKRILDRINPYEARYNDFFNNESPAVYSSQIQIAGPPFAGKVALNPDKNVIENTGLIELYETVLARARELSIDNSSNAVSTDGINQALLLAATRLAVLYELLAREAYSDAQDSTITVTDTSDLARVASFTHSFQNFEPDLLHEELALLRGTDFRKSYPVFNRMFWNYAKGLGEAAYNVNYNIYDENTDGFINEDDARALYPQGHGDAWGHFVSALGMHYTLLEHPVFSWKTRSELYALMQNVLEVDFLDEKTFATLAAGKARAGRDIVRGTYRLDYTQDPGGQWQGYTDSANPARAWGVSEWATRTGQAAYFDWAVANAILPEEAAAATPVDNPENLDRIQRAGAIDEIGEIAGGLYEIQVAMDEANGGVNPLGFDADALTFDLDPSLLAGTELNRQTHFEQVYERAVAAGNNAMATLDFASKAGNKLMRIADSTEAMIVEAFRQDLDYRNRLIDIFGRPYGGTIGSGKLYPEGFEGPDTQLYAYLDHTTIDQIVPAINSGAAATDVTFTSTLTRARGLADDDHLEALYADVFGSFFENIGTIFTASSDEFLGVGVEELQHAFVTLQGTQTYQDWTEVVPAGAVPVRRRSPYAFQAAPDWGRRTSYGKIQRILEEELRERIALDSAIAEYVALIQDLEAVVNRIEGDLTLSEARDDIQLQISILRKQLQLVKLTGQALIGAAKFLGLITKEAGDAAAAFLPTSAGFSVDIGAPGRGAAKISTLTAITAANATDLTARKVFQVAEFAAALLIGDLERDLEKAGELADIEGLLVELVSLTGKEIPLRNALGTHLQNIELKQQEFITAQAEGFRLLREREGFNKILAAKAQKNRYQDMLFRIARNEAMTKYQSAFDHAARYAWMAARAYDYETSLDPGSSAAPGALLDQIVKERQLGLWVDGAPQAGQNGLAEILNHLNGNFQVLKGQLGLNNPQSENEKISLRAELFRIGPGLAGGGTTASDDRWEDALKARIVPDLNQLPEFRRYCRPFAAGVQPGIVIRFPTTIEAGLNLFGQPLVAGDHNYSTANFATKIHGFGAWLDNYNAAGLSTTPRAYLVPVGNDYMRQSSSAEATTRMWSVQEQRIPTPFVINEANLKSPGFIPTLNGVDGGFSELRRHGDFRVYHNAGGAVQESELIPASRLIGRSVWNSEWLLIIPGAGLHVNPNTGLMQLANTISDIKLHFSTYSHQGQ